MHFCVIAGIGLLLRKAASTVKPEQTWTQDPDGTIHVQTDTTLMKREQLFKLGEEFEEKRVDDEIAKVWKALFESPFKIINFESQANGLCLTCFIFVLS